MLFNFLFDRLKKNKAISPRAFSIQSLESRMLLTATVMENQFATYLGGSNITHIRDVTVDKNHNFYVAGGTAAPDFPTTPGAYDRTANGNWDAFAAKFNSSGQLVWATLLGGPNYDRAYAIELDSHGNIVIAGRAGDQFPTTQGALQRNFAGDTNASPLYGKQDGFIAKISADGSQLLWSTYFGDPTRGFIRDVALDSSDKVYVVLTEASGPVSYVTPGAWETKYKGRSDGVIANITSDGSRVLWASYAGGSEDDMFTASIRVDHSGYVYVLGSTTSSDIITTPNALQRHLIGAVDLQLVKFKPGGSDVVYSTYLGGNGEDFTETHELAVDNNGNAYLASITSSTDFPTTPGSFQPTYQGTGGSGTGVGTNYPGDGFIAKISADGTSILAATYLGGNLGDGIEGVSLDAQGNVYVSGATFSTNFPVTPDAYQKTAGGKGDLFVAVLSNDLSHLIYGSYLGGSAVDFGRTSIVSPDGWFAVAGHADSGNWPTNNAYQSSKLGPTDAVLAVFAPVLVFQKIQVSLGTTVISDDTTAPISFGSVTQGGTPFEQSFTITNSSTQAMTVGSINLDNNVGFEVIQQPTSPIPAGASTTFVIRLLTDTIGNASANVRFTNSDAVANPFNFPITGSVVSASPLILNGTAGNDSFYLQSNVAGQLQIWQNSDPNSAPPDQILNPANYQGLIINGLDGDDTVTVDFSKGNPLPAAGLIYNGGTFVTGDVLRIIGTTGPDIITVNDTQVLFGSAAITLNAVERVDVDGQAGGDHISALGNANINLWNTMDVGSLSIADNARVSVPPGGAQPVQLSDLSIADNGTLDLNDNDLILQSTLAERDARLSQLSGYIHSGRSKVPTLWSGNGIISSSAAANPFTGLAIIINDKGNGKGPLYAALDGVAVDTNSILVKYTWNGDSDLNGVLDVDDYFQIDRGFFIQATTYRNGDFDLNGAVDADDYFLIDTAFMNQSGVLSSPASVVAVSSQSASASKPHATHHRRPHHRAKS